MAQILRPEFVLRTLNGLRVRYLVVGSYAAQLHGAEWNPRGIDVVVPRNDPPNAGRILDAVAFLELVARSVTTEHLEEPHAGAPGVHVFTRVGDGLSFEDLVCGSRWLDAGDGQRAFVASRDSIVRLALSIGRHRDHLLVQEIDLLEQSGQRQAT